MPLLLACTEPVWVRKAATINRKRQRAGTGETNLFVIGRGEYPRRRSRVQTKILLKDDYLWISRADFPFWDRGRAMQGIRRAWSAVKHDCLPIADSCWQGRLSAAPPESYSVLRGGPDSPPRHWEKLLRYPVPEEQCSFPRDSAWHTCRACRLSSQQNHTRRAFRYSCWSSS